MIRGIIKVCVLKLSEVLRLKATYKNIISRIAFFILIALAVTPLLLSQELKQQISDALESGDTALAIDYLEKEIALDPSYEYNYLALGDIYLARKKLELAEEQFRISVEKNKKFYPGLYSLGLIQLKLGKVDEAEKNLSQGLKKSREMKAEFHNGMGLVYMVRKEFNKADAELRKAIVLDSMNAEFHVNLGDINFMMQVYPLAIAEYEKALELDTASLGVYFRWAEACLELKDYTCALDKLNIVLQRDSTYAQAWMNAGGIYYKAARSSRNIAEAKEHYKATIGSYKKFFELSNEEPDSANGRAFYEAGMSYLILGGYPEAKENFATVLSIPVEPKDIYFYYARAYQGNGEFDSALVLYKNHIDWVKNQGEDYTSGVRDVELYRRMGECYQSLEDRYNTIAYYKKSLEYDSTQARLLYGVAVAYNYNQDYRNALIYYMKRIALGADERFWSIYFNAAMSALYLADKGGQAMMEDEELGLDDEDVADSPETDPLEGINLAQLAVDYLEKVCSEYWEKVVSNERNMKTAIKALNMLGSTYLYQLGDCANGVKNLERVLEQDPVNCDALKSLGYAYFGGICPVNYTRALGYLQRALDCTTRLKGSKCQAADILLWIAQTYEFRAIAKAEAKQKEESEKDYKLAHDGYLGCLKCDPGNNDAIEGERRTKFNF